MNMPTNHTDPNPRPGIPAGTPPTPAPDRATGGFGVAGWIIAALLCAGAVVGYRQWHRADGTAPGGAAPAKAEIPPVPVVLGTVAQRDVPIYLEGLGTVQAFQTVTIRARVDGQVRRIAFSEGQDVKAGDLLAEIDPDPYHAQVEQAQAKQAQDEALLANARIDAKRYADLLAHEGVTQQTYDTQKALAIQLEAAVKADQAAVHSARVQLDYTSIVSPIDGRTGIRLVDQGNIVRAADASGIVVVAQLKPVSVVFTLPEQTLASIRLHAGNGMPAVVAVDRDNPTPIAEGQLAVIDNQIDTATGTIRLKATFPNADLRLWPGQFVNARLRLTVRPKSAVVPASVIQRGPDGAFAFVAKDDQTVELRAVKVAQIEAGEALVEDGLRPGEKVVVEGQYRLQRGSKINPIEPSAPGSGRGGGGGGGGRGASGGTNAPGGRKP